MSTNIHIVCSSKREAGKTLLARICGDVLSLSDQGVTVFDTAFPSGPLARWFPKNSGVIDFRKMREQVKLFDKMVNEPGRNYVIEVQPEHLESFFMMLHDTGFVDGAREAGIGTGVFFIREDAEEDGARTDWLRHKIKSASLTIVDRKGKVTASTRWSRKTLTLVDPKCRETVMPQLSDAAKECIQRPNFKFGWYYTGSVVRPPPEVKLELSFFMEKLRDWSTVAGWNETLAL